MSQSTAKSERITAIVSTLVAVAILAAGGTAQQLHTAPQDELALLESDFRFQLDNTFRHGSKQRAERLAQLGEVMKAWRQSSRSESDRTLLASWLLEATIRSMPDATEPMPNAPEFGEAKATAPAKSVARKPLPPSNDLTDLPEQTAAQIAVTDAPQSQQTPATIEKPVTINLTVLSARIADYHDGLNQVETALLTAKSPDLSFLEKQIQQLDELTRDFRFVKLYYEALSNEQRQTVRSVRSMEAALADLGRLLGRTGYDQNGDFLESFDSAHNERIEKLRQQLATIASRTK